MVRACGVGRVGIVRPPAYCKVCVETPKTRIGIGALIVDGKDGISDLSE